MGDYFDDSNSPFDLDNVGFEPTPYFQDFSDEKTYYECPAWKHKALRTYNIYSPVDLDFELCGNDNIASRKLPQELLIKYLAPKSNESTIQLELPRFLFWTKHKNVWIECKPHPLTSSKNNLIAVAGWWNLSLWSRPTSFAFDVVDSKKPIIVNRGDAVQQICFYSNNLNDTFKLIKQQPPQDLIKRTLKNLHVKNYIAKYANQLIFQKQESKCPFSFLFDK